MTRERAGRAPAMWRALGLRGGLLLLLSASACGGAGEEHEEEELLRKEIPRRVQRDGSIRLSAADRKALGLQVAPAERVELGDFALRFGRAEARPGEQSVVVAPVAGRILQPPAVELGASVAAGADIVAITPVLATAERLTANVRGAELRGQIEALQRDLDTRAAEFGRAEQLARSQIVSQAKLQEASTALAGARAQLQALRRAHGIQARGEAAPIMLTAPAAGSIAAIDAPLGALVGAGAVLTRILRPGPLWIDARMLPEDAQSDHYEVQVARAWLPARLIARGAVVAEDGFRHDRLELAQADAAQLLPGATVSIQALRDTAPGVCVPETALVPAPDGDSVYVETAPGSFVRRPVRVHDHLAGNVRLASGLQVGEAVVVRGAQALRGEGLRAQLQEPD